MYPIINSLSTVESPSLTGLIFIKGIRKGFFLDSSLGKEYLVDNSNNSFELKELKKYKLKSGAYITLKKSIEDKLFYLESFDLNLQAYGKTFSKCLRMMQEEIENLYEELNSDDNFSPEYLKIKAFLNKIINAE